MTSHAEFLQALRTIPIHDAVADHTHGVMDNLPEAYSTERRELADEMVVKAGMQSLSLLEMVVSPRPSDDPADRFPLGRRTMAGSHLSEDFVSYRIIRHLIMYLVRKGATIPTTSDMGLFNPGYQHLTTIDQLSALVECYAVLIQCSLSDREYFQTLTWFEDMQAVEYRSRSAVSSGLHDWQHRGATQPHLTTQLVECLVGCAFTYTELQNTAASHHVMVLADRLSESLPQGGNLWPAMNRPDGTWKRAMARCALLRHPEPNMGFKLELKDSRLQVCGAWRRIPLKSMRLWVEDHTYSYSGGLHSKVPGATQPLAENDPNVPGPRYSAASWVDRGRFFVLYGVCERARPGFAFNNDVGPSEPWAWNDLWSWDVEGEKWRRERIAGNPPAPRFEMGYVHNEKLGKVIIFGGANPMCHSKLTLTADHTLNATILADAFLLSTTAEQGDLSSDGTANSTTSEESRKTARFLPGAYSWKQIMTCGFPTHRADAALVCDPETGKIYMYGGRVRTELIPSRKQTQLQAIKQAKIRDPFIRGLAEQPGGAGEHWHDLAGPQTTRHFGHVWQLHVDIPGGNFEVIDKEEEIRTAQAGPWDRCFECGKAGFWKQCAGSCGGRAHFCGRECQLKGWSAHKKMHSCRKL